ncbi:MAG: hypothetical protein PHC34_09930 [Candidatus Gastranaerophilales bacterium]|nr:hypothetical protein [Candidatus Gastranaerophilales bacterium]
MKLKEQGYPDKLLALATDGRGGCKEGIKEICGKKGTEESFKIVTKAYKICPKLHYFR